MSKIPVNTVCEILKRNDLEPALLRQIVEEMNQAVEPEVDEEKAPAVKKQFSIVVSDPDGVLIGKDLVGYVFQIPEDASVTSTRERIHKAVYEYHTSKKGRMYPIRTFGEAVESLPGKHTKEQQVWIKTRAPVFVIADDNEIPTEASERAEGGGK
jgi:hypothetical protein